MLWLKNPWLYHESGRWPLNTRISARSPSPASLVTQHCGADTSSLSKPRSTLTHLIYQEKTQPRVSRQMPRRRHAKMLQLSVAQTTAGGASQTTGYLKAATAGSSSRRLAISHELVLPACWPCPAAAQQRFQRVHNHTSACSRVAAREQHGNGCVLLLCEGKRLPHATTVSLNVVCKPVAPRQQQQLRC